MVINITRFLEFWGQVTNDRFFKDNNETVHFNLKASGDHVLMK